MSALVVNNSFGVTCMGSVNGFSSEERLSSLRLHISMSTIHCWFLQSVLFVAGSVDSGLNLLLQYDVVSAKGGGFLHFFHCWNLCWSCWGCLGHVESAIPWLLYWLYLQAFLPWWPLCGVQQALSGQGHWHKGRHCTCKYQESSGINIILHRMAVNWCECFDALCNWWVSEESFESVK